MATRPSLEDVPRGNTCAGVNRYIIEHLLAQTRDWSAGRFLDLPCGTGIFLDTLRKFFPGAEIRGADLAAVPGRPDIASVDLSRPFAIFPEGKFDVITSISGVMEFDNTRQFLEACAAHLRNDGRLIVTNDNTVTMRDRLEFLVLGRVRRFRLFVAPNEPTWKQVSIQNLIRILHDAGFVVERIQYLCISWKDWFFLPAAMLLWPLQWLHRKLARSGLPPALRRSMLPFRALLCRHYVVICRKSGCD